MSLMKTTKPTPEDILRWFRQGADTQKIAYLFRMSESDVANLLGQAKDAEYNKDHSTVSTECEPPVEDQQERGDA
jgi:uncharacterized protein (DUF433 family)